MPRYSGQRPHKTPPHVPLRALRTVSGMTLEQVCAGVSEVLGSSRPMTRGALSAIELGIRGASQEVLAALEHVYGIEPGSIVTEFPPRTRGSNGGDQVA